MDKLTSLLGKLVLTKQGIELGTVSAVQLDRQLKNIKNIGYMTTDGIQFFPYSALFAYDKDVLILKNQRSIPYKNCITLTMGMAVYTVFGEYIGKLTNLQLENFTVLHALLDDNSPLLLQECIGITDSIIIDKTGKERRQIGNLPKKNSTRQSTKIVQKENQQIVDSSATEQMIDGIATAQLTADSNSQRQQKNGVQIQNHTAFGIEQDRQLPLGNTAQVVVPSTLAYTSDAQTAPIYKNSFDFRPQVSQTQVSQKQALQNLPQQESMTSLKSLQEVYANQQFLQHASKEVGTTVLTGRQLLADLLDDYGNILIDKYTVIAPEHIKRAVDNNKLFQLIQLVNKF